MRQDRFSWSLWVAEALLRLVLPAPTAAAVVGDLEEDLASTEGRRRFPRTWLLGQVARHGVASIRLGSASPRPSIGFFRACRHAFRPWRRQPATAALAIVILGAAFGAHTAFFGLLDGVVFRPLDIDHAEELVAVGTVDSRGHAARVSSAVLRQLQTGPPLFRSLAGYIGGRMTVEVHNSIANVPVGLVSGSFFDVVRGEPIRGRLIEPADVASRAASSAHVAVIGARFWQTVLQGDPQIVGQTLRLEGVPLVIVGVAPEQLTGLQVEAMNDVVAPSSLMPELFDDPDIADGVSFPSLVGRLPSGQTLPEVNAALAGRWPSIVAATTPNSPSAQANRSRATVTSAAAGFSFLRVQYEPLLRLLTGLAGVMIFVACLSVGGLIAASAVARRPEFLIRMALGASRLDIALQVFAEAAVICAAGSVLGFVIGSAVMRPVLNWSWPDVNLQDVRLSADWRLLAMTVAITLSATVVAAMVPTVLATKRVGQVGLLNARTSSSTRGLWQSYALVAQLSLTLALLVGAGLLVRTLDRARPETTSLDLGHTIIAKLTALPKGYVNQTDAAYYASLVDRLKAMPGVSSAAIVKSGPFSGLGAYGLHAVERTDSLPTEAGLATVVTYVSPGFFDTIGGTLLEGRDFTWADTKVNEVAVVSASLASRLFPSGDALGRQVRIHGDPAHPALRIVGVVAETRYQDLKEPHPFVVYLSAAAEGMAQWGNAVIRTASPSSFSTEAMNEAIRPLGHEQVLWARTFAEEENLVLLKERLAASIGALFALLSGLLAATGVYGRLSQIVTQRRQEVGIRLALGAAPSSIRLAMLREGTRLGLWSVVVGLPIAVGLARLASGQLYGLTVYDPMVFGVATALLITLSVCASYGPARRIVRDNPLDVLRSQ